MTKHLVKVTQTLKIKRMCQIGVEAETIADAIEMVRNGEIDLPSFNDNAWVFTHETLEDEDVAEFIPPKLKLPEMMSKAPSEASVKIIADPYEDGEIAALTGAPKTANPYNLETEKDDYNDWLDGWNSALDDARQALLG